MLKCIISSQIWHIKISQNMRCQIGHIYPKSARAACEQEPISGNSGRSGKHQLSPTSSLKTSFGYEAGPQAPAFTAFAALLDTLSTSLCPGTWLEICCYSCGLETFNDKESDNDWALHILWKSSEAQRHNKQCGELIKLSVNQCPFDRFPAGNQPVQSSTEKRREEWSIWVSGSMSKFGS